MSIAVAKDANGVYYLPVDVKNPSVEVGKLTCPSCSCEVIPKVKGSIRVPHFAHKGNTSSCSGAGGEGMIHRLAKDDIRDNTSSYSLSNVCNQCEGVVDLVLPENHTSATEVRVGTKRVDVAIFSSTGAVDTCIEVFNTHRLDIEKLIALYEKTKGNVFEIDATKVVRGERILRSSLTCRRCIGVTVPVNHTTRRVLPVSSQIIEEDARTRESFKEMKIVPGRVSVVQGTAGSGKTTLLESFISRNPGSRFLYLCFNKDLREEMSWRFSAKLPHVTVKTFDSLWHSMYMPHHKKEKIRQTFLMEYSDEMDRYLDGSSIDTFKAPVRAWIQKEMKKPWWTFKRKPWEIYNNPEKYGVLRAFSGYDVVILDEAQDMQPMTSRIIKELNGGGVHLIYAGDPDQQLYKYTGAIDAMKGVRHDDLFILNRTFRFGVDVCNYINEAGVNRYANVSGRTRNTPVISATLFEKMGTASYSYLFRTVSGMVRNAEASVKRGEKVCIDFETRVGALRQEKCAMERAKKLGERLYLDNATQGWLESLDKNKLDELEKIFEDNKKMVSDHTTTFSTVHKFKGKEDDVVRVNTDVTSEMDTCIRNVGLTRARKLLVLDSLEFYQPRHRKRTKFFN